MLLPLKSVAGLAETLSMISHDDIHTAFGVLGVVDCGVFAFEA